MRVTREGRREEEEEEGKVSVSPCFSLSDSGICKPLANQIQGVIFVNRLPKRR